MMAGSVFSPSKTTAFSAAARSFFFAQVECLDFCLSYEATQGECGDGDCGFHFHGMLLVDVWNKKVLAIYACRAATNEFFYLCQ